MRESDISSYPIIENANFEIDLKPKVGMVFDSLEAASKFWVDYGKRVGFGVRKLYTNKSKKDGSIGTCRFVCCKEGLRRKDKRDHLTINPRLETRTDCKARMGVTNMGGKFIVHDFVEEHNHELHLQETTHMLASHRNLLEVQASEIDLAEDSGLQQRASYVLMSRHAGGRINLGYTRLDQKNYLRTKRQRSLMYGEAGYLLQYFQRQILENPSFYHAYQMDMEEQITNVFWADARMLIDYAYFGDVVCLDTTYCTNRAQRPLALFSGFNHYRGVVIFGAALLYDETAESFKWLFETFLEAHSQKKPQTIFTDQDQAMAKALLEVMPDTYHGLCTWHLMQNGIKHLGNLIQDNSHFLSDFKACMYKYKDEAQFEAAWSILISKYDVHENPWLRSIYNIKEKWAACHMKKAFTLGIRSTQLSESLNSSFKSCMKPDLNIIQFFNHFERVVEDKRYNELKNEFESRQKLPRLKNQYSPMLRQLYHIYTFTIFDIFQKEFELLSAACVKHIHETPPLFEYIITLFDQEGEWRVLFDRHDDSITCSCKKFETFGILCCHALKVLDIMNVKLVPDPYILKRWSKQARSGIIHDVRGNEVQGDVRLATTKRYRQICPQLIKIAAEASSNQEAFLFLSKAANELSKQITEICSQQINVGNDIGETTINASGIESMAQVKGFKKRDGRKGKKRLKSWVETQSKRRKKTSCANVSHIQQKSMDNELALRQVQCGISQLTTPAICDHPQITDNQFSFTRFLLESLDHPIQSLEVSNLYDNITNLNNQEG